MRFIDPDGRSPLDWYWNQKTQRVEWRNSSKKYINEGNGAILNNVGKTKQDVMNSFGVASRMSVKERALSGSASWELHEDKTPTKGGVPIPMGSYDGIVSINLSNDLTTAKDSKGVTYIDDVKTTINATYNYNDQALNIDKNTVFFSEISATNQYLGEGKMTWQSGLDNSRSFNQDFGSNFHPLNFKPINIKSDFNQYISNALNFKLTLKGTNTTTTAFSHTTYLTNQKKR